MADTSNKPVIFLAFANDRNDAVGYLRNLPVEARKLREVLEPAERAGLCELVVRSNSSAGDIFKVFEDSRYRNRVAILHYGGHANGYELLLESASGETAVAGAGGLAKFLGQQYGLQLVFLNGCSTQAQTQGLLDANISAVISTSRSIEDLVATEFSYQFYQGLAGGATIRTAYNEAEAAVRTSLVGSSIRGLYFGAKNLAKLRPETDRWPWNLYLRDGSEDADQWSLPKAVNDPLFGLPQLPERDLPESPYKHLNWFTREDAEVFFGRGHEIRELYDRLTSGTWPIVLFYGQSGVGKSSLLDAGLMPRLERDYEVRYERRGASGLLATLQTAMHFEVAEALTETVWLAKEEQLKKPLIVFLDQVEEFYTRPIADFPEELDELLQFVKATFNDPSHRPKGKLVLSFREEWLAKLEAHLKDYQLSRTKVFLKPLDRHGVIEVVQGPARTKRLQERYALTVDEGLAEMIADDLLADRGSAISTTLQILLSKMWTNATDSNSEPPRFSQDLYLDLKHDGILLRDFLNQQISAFRERYPEAVDSGLLLDIVALHTTPLGTANQCTVEQLRQLYAHVGAKFLDLLQQCQDLYLLTVVATTHREGAKTTRLAHDTLAPVVREQFDSSDKPGQRARRILDSRSVDWEQDRKGTPLDEADLQIIEQGIAGTRDLNATERRLVEASRVLRVQLKRKQATLKAASVMAVATVTITAGIALWQWSKAEAAKVVAIEAKANAVKERDAKEIARKEAETAKLQALVQLAEANQNLGLALLERAKKYMEEGKHSHAYITAGRAIGFDGCGGPLKRFPPLLSRTDTDAFLRASTIVRHSAARAHRPERIVYETKEPDVFGFAIDSSGLRLAIENTVGETHIVDLNNGGAILKLTGYKTKVIEVQFSKTGMLATTHKDGSVLIWDLSSQTKRIIAEPSGSTFYRLNFSPDGKLLAAAGESENAAFVWDLEKCTRTPLLSEPGDAVISVAFAPNCRHLATGSKSGMIKIFELESGQVVAKYQAHTSHIWSLAFHPNGDRFASGGGDDSVKVWSLSLALAAAAQKPIALIEIAPLGTIEAHRDQVSRVAFSTGGETLASSSWDGTVLLSDASTMQSLACLDAHGGRVDGLAFLPGDSRLVTAELKGTVRIWHVRRDRLKPKILRAHTQPMVALALHPNGKSIASGGWDGQVLVWDLATGANQLIYPKSTDIDPKHVEVASLTYSPSGERVFAAFGNGQIIAFDASTGNRLFRVVDKPAGYIHTIAISPDGQLLASTGEDGKVRVWNALSGESIISFNAHLAKVMSVLFTPSGLHLISSGADGIIKVWDRTNMFHLVWEKQIHKESTQFGMVVSRDGRQIVSVGYDRKICITETESRNTIASWDAGVQLHLPVVLTGDMRLIAVTCLDNTVRIWDVKERKQIAIMPASKAYLYTLALGPKDDWLAYPGENGTIDFLDMQMPRVTKLDESQFHFNGLDVVFGPPE
jgi:WD40 repeat protein